MNPGGHNKVVIADLRGLWSGWGCRMHEHFCKAATWCFEVTPARLRKLERMLDAEAAKRLGLETDFLVRTAKDWKAIIAGNPFPTEAKRDPCHLLVMFLKHAPDRASATVLQKAIAGREVVRTKGRPSC